MVPYDPKRRLDQHRIEDRFASIGIACELGPGFRAGPGNGADTLHAIAFMARKEGTGKTTLSASRDLAEAAVRDYGAKVEPGGPAREPPSRESRCCRCLVL